LSGDEEDSGDGEEESKEESDEDEAAAEAQEVLCTCVSYSAIVYCTTPITCLIMLMDG
jgi:hypothetical protein